jgi:hypothetical protein
MRRRVDTFRHLDRQTGVCSQIRSSKRLQAVAQGGSHELSSCEGASPRRSQWVPLSPPKESISKRDRPPKERRVHQRESGTTPPPHPPEASLTLEGHASYGEQAPPYAEEPETLLWLPVGIPSY